MKPKECIICGNSFQPNKDIQKTCSDKCRREKDRLCDKEYRKNHKEEISKKAKEYYLVNKDGIIKHRRNRNRKKILETHRRYYINNKEKFKRNYIKNRDKINERTREYKKNNKIKVNARNHAERNRLQESYCSKCGSRENLEFHHTDYELRRGVTLCRTCHRELHRTRLEE